MTLARKLKDLRAERNWTQLELAKRSGLDRGYIANLEGSKSIQRPSADAFLKLARAFNIKPEELYQAAGYIKETKIPYHPETPEEILDKLRLATPQSIPVYPWEAFPFHAGDGVEPIEYIYRAHLKLTSKNIEAYIIHGSCLEPKLVDGDIIIVDRDGIIDNGDIVACLLDGKFHVLRIRKVADELWLENNRGKFKFEDCQYAAPVIECIRRLK
jgi:transcriptional regulator with XRE-family HTH domain